MYQWWDHSSSSALVLWHLLAACPPLFFYHPKIIHVNGGNGAACCFLTYILADLWLPSGLGVHKHRTYKTRIFTGWKNRAGNQKAGWSGRGEKGREEGLWAVDRRICPCRGLQMFYGTSALFSSVCFSNIFYSSLRSGPLQDMHVILLCVVLASVGQCM